MRPFVLGCDPGLSGAFALVDECGSLIALADLPTRGVGARQMLDTGTLRDVLESHEIGLAVIELVGAMPKQGVSSVWKFGYAAGQLEGVISGLNIPIMWATPQSWKRAFKLPADKEAARSMAIELWPQHRNLFKRKADAGRAEAALIALHGVPYLKTKAAA